MDTKELAYQVSNYENKFFFTAGTICMLLGVASGADVDYDREWNPYVTLRGGWLFDGKARHNYHWYGRDPGPPLVGADRDVTANTDRNFGSAWSGSGEVGVLLCEDRVSVGLELRYFAGEKKVVFVENGEPGVPNDYYYVGVIYFSEGDCYYRADGKYKNLFAAFNVTLKKDVGERAFLYGGVGAGMARSDFGELKSKWDDAGAWVTGKIDFKSKWRFLGQVFAGVGIYLDDNWSLGIGYRMRYLTGDVNGSKDYGGGVKWDWKVKQDLSHAVEVGLTYQF